MWRQACKPYRISLCYEKSVNGLIKRMYGYDDDTHSFRVRSSK